MAKKKRAVKIPKAELMPKVLRLPKDWIERIDNVRGTQSFNEFVRSAILDKIGGSEGLSVVPGWGMGRLGMKKS